ncbi:FAD-dependent monooxygenase [Actinomadura sp. NEAU-AAG7]|uniref:FAD-dependent monooxygenase n=1 Tax=Actinomadura sp. NEAU-AAG7 TaxID=2839640 RepID=UPI001BE49409|nr:FAD-dependent monooxygenase [Actinomadura sp. NEAU-AAG7]MBT2207995.1 FAD-dependent monooxygenase [Actinomadura sp. NEAU-AAG7]
MAADADPRQVVVVGAGPAGLLLAGSLRLGGAEVTVLERRTERATETRATTLNARTMEIFDKLGLLDLLGVPPNEPMGHFGGIPLDLSQVDSPYPGQWKVPQTRVEELLEKWAIEQGAQVRRGVGVRSVRVRSTFAEVGGDGLEEPLRAAYLVGCDGQDSTVRSEAGIAFPGTSATHELLAADVAGIDVPNRRFERFPAGLAVASRRSDGLTRVMVHRHGHLTPRRIGTPSFGEVAAAWRTVTGESIGHGTAVWLHAFDNAARQAERFRRGRILLAGDAAHRQMPVGGLPINLGIQDAHALGPALAAVATGRGPESLLEDYHDRRHGTVRKALSAMRVQEQLLLGGPEQDPHRALIADLMTHRSVRRKLAAFASGLDHQEDEKDAEEK